MFSRELIFFVALTYFLAGSSIAESCTSVEFTISPDRPMPGDRITIRARDTPTHYMPDFTVTVYNFRAMGVTKTSSFYGRATFTPTEKGKYRITMEGGKYCGSMEFYVKEKMTVTGPPQENYEVGGEIRLVVPRGVGIKVIRADGTLYKVVSTDLGGSASFFIDEPGAYIINIGEISTVYWDVNKTVTVYPPPTTTTTTTTTTTKTTTTTTSTTSTTTTSTTSTTSSTTTTLPEKTISSIWLILAVVLGATVFLLLCAIVFLAAFMLARRSKKQGKTDSIESRL